MYVIQNSKLTVTNLIHFQMANESTVLAIHSEKASTESSLVSQIIIRNITRTVIHTLYPPTTPEIYNTEYTLPSVYLNVSLPPIRELNTSSTDKSNTEYTMPVLNVSSLPTTELTSLSADNSSKEYKLVRKKNDSSPVADSSPEYTMQPIVLNVSSLPMTEVKSLSTDKSSTDHNQRLTVSNVSSTTSTTVSSPCQNSSTEYTLRSTVFNVSLSPLRENSLTADNSSKENKGKAVHYFRCAGPIGRLGNMMFQLSATLGIAHTLGYKPYIESSHPLNKYFDIKQILDLNLTNVMTFNDEQCKNKTWMYNKEYITHNLTTWGYLQSWIYFENNSDEVRKAFTIKTNYLQDAQNFLKAKANADDVLVGIHIRRGDFTSDYNKGLGYTMADGNYTRKAMEWHRKKTDHVSFVVVSDDIKWCQDNIKGNDVIYSNFSEPIIDLAIMSLCHHAIITGGSFSWWGGWLAGGTVVYLKDFPRPGTWLEKEMHNIDEYYPSHWIGMSNGSK